MISSQSAERRLQLLFDLSPLGIVLLNNDAQIIESNLHSQSMLGHSSKRKNGTLFSSFFSEKEQVKLLKTFENNKAVQKILHQEYAIVSGNKSLIIMLDSDYMEIESEIFHFIVFRDITEQKQVEERIHHMAYHDTLTGLSNRVALMERLTKVFFDNPEPSLKTLMLLDLDGFKAINDTKGHGVGDVMLKHVAQQISKTKESEDTIARLGGDEFAMIYPNLQSEEEAREIAKELLKNLSTPLIWNEEEIIVTASIGVLITTLSNAEPSKVLRLVDEAM